MRYRPLHELYSQPPAGWHDEPFEYCFSFFKAFAGITPASQATFLNQPLRFDPDADFYIRGMAALYDNPNSGEFANQILFSLRLRDPFGRALDNAAIPLSAYCGAPPTFPGGVYASVVNAPVATPWYPELYVPANSAMFADFVAYTNSGQAYSFQIYFQGVKRFNDALTHCGRGTAA